MCLFRAIRLVALKSWTEKAYPTDLLQPAPERRTLRGLGGAGTFQWGDSGVVPITALVKQAPPGLLAVDNAFDFGFKTKQLALLNSVYREAY